MQTMKRKTWAVVALVAVIALIAVAACQAPAPTGPTHVVLDNAYEIGASGEGPAGAAGDTNFTNLVASGDLTVAGDAVLGSLSVTGGVTGTNVLTTGDQTIAGVKTFTTPAVLPAVTGPTAVATAVPGFYVNNLGAANVSFEVRDAATPVFQVLNGGAVAAGAVNMKAPVLAKTANYAVATTDSGAVIKSSGSITMTLPGAVAGLGYCIVNFDGGDLTIDFTDTADVALNEVNSPGDRVTNTTAYESICLTAVDATNWMTLSSLGTWADGN